MASFSFFFLFSRLFTKTISWTSTIHPGIFLGRAPWEGGGRFPFYQKFWFEISGITYNESMERNFPVG